MATIQIKRGNKINLPETASPGEPLITLDTNELFFGTTINTIEALQLASENIIDKGAPDGVSELDSDGDVPHSIKTDTLFVSGASQITLQLGQNLEIVSLPTSAFRVCKWLINVTDQTTGNFYSCELLAHHNNSTADFSQYGVIGEETVEFNVIVEGANLKLYGLSLKNNQIVRVITTAIRFT
jgi:hypothetical protein